MKAQAERKDSGASGDTGTKEHRQGARVVATGAPTEIVAPSTDNWRPDSDNTSKKAAFGQ